jgi:putative tryptophan/tyrosine transport system substrate-binding protein
MKRREFIAGLGGAAVWPWPVQGQQRTVPVVGVLTNGTESSMREGLAAFLQGLRFVEGQNVEILSRHPQNRGKIGCPRWLSI